MPSISHLNIQHFRNLGSISMEPSKRINIILGQNGAGKSSILESISMLAHGRSFRTHKYRSLIQDEKAEFVVHGKVDGDDGAVHQLGLLRRRKGDFTIKLDGKTVASASSLAKHIPLLVINSGSFALLEGSPKDRRKFFDWLVFHVKHQFSASWNQVIRCYKQRNSLLRRDKISYSDLEPWDIEIVKLSELIACDRESSFNLLNDHFTSILKPLLGRVPEGISLELKQGWKLGEGSFSKQLRNSFERDKSYGYSTLGPHKSDFVVKTSAGNAVDILSRGQQKLLISALYIAQAAVLKETNAQTPIFAVDDLPSELDQANQKLMGDWLNELGSQVFITGIEASCRNSIWPDYETYEEPLKMFHVKHGELV